MKPLYVPNRIIYAVQTVEKEHPLVGTAPSAISDNALKELVLLIDSKPMKELEKFAALLSRREANALCRYIGHNAYKVDLKKVVQVIYFCMSPANYKTLFEVWERVPECSEALFLLGRFDDPKYREPDFPVQKGLLSAWAKSSMPIAAIAQTSTDIGQGRFFNERLRSIGLWPESALGKLCYQHFFCRASVTQFEQEGDYKLYEVLCQSDKQMQEQILIHLLNFGEKVEQKLLPSLKDTYQKAYALWKDPNSKFFPVGHQRAYETYTWWYNYYQMVSAFGKDADRRRINYWKQYLHKCTCSRVHKHAMLVMDFGQYIVTEFESMGAVYIFETSYYKETVTIKFRAHNTNDFKSWLYNYAAHKDRQTHTQRWEYNQTWSLRRFNII